MLYLFIDIQLQYLVQSIIIQYMKQSYKSIIAIIIKI